MNYGYIPEDDPSYNFVRREKFAENCALILSECLKNKEDKEMSKSFDKKDVFSWANCEDAKQYIGKEGYFAESISILERDIEQQHTSRLIGVDITEVCCFYARNKGNYSLFLPIDKVKKPEKKWRAFKDIREFADTLGIKNKFLVGASITWRAKDKHSKQGVSLITNTFILSENEIFITLGSQTYIIDRLFTDLEWLDKDGNWQPFGVLDES